MKERISPRPRACKRFAFLLLFFLVQLITMPLFERSMASGMAGDILNLLFLAAAAYAVKKSRYFKVAIIFGACIILEIGRASCRKRV